MAIVETEQAEERHIQNKTVFQSIGSVAQLKSSSNRSVLDSSTKESCPAIRATSQKYLFNYLKQDE